MAFILWTAEQPANACSCWAAHHAGICACIESLGSAHTVLATCQTALRQAHGPVAPLWDAALQVANPACVFMDEPTSGGDLTAALLLEGLSASLAPAVQTSHRRTCMPLVGEVMQALIHCFLVQASSVGCTAASLHQPRWP